MSCDGRVIELRPGLLTKTVKREGAGELPEAGQAVFVHYTGRLNDGTVFDSSRSRGEFSFRLGAGEVIKGWDLGVGIVEHLELATFGPCHMPHSLACSSKLTESRTGDFPCPISHCLARSSEVDQSRTGDLWSMPHIP